MRGEIEGEGMRGEMHLGREMHLSHFDMRGEMDLKALRCVLSVVCACRVCLPCVLAVCACRVCLPCVLAVLSVHSDGRHVYG